MEGCHSQSRQSPVDGTWEAEVSYGGEADLHRHLNACDKNPGHQKFVPVDQFNVEHLPSGYHDNDIVGYVRAVSDLTVRVSVTCVSESRPETVPGSDKPYPCYSNRGTDMMRVGTGWIRDVWTFPNEDQRNGTCSCKECLNSATPKTQFARFYIRTAANVVYDELEAAHTTCHLFFDRGDTPETCSGVVTLSGMSEVVSDSEIDYCDMRYYTHDLDLANKLKKMVDNLTSIGGKIISKYKNPKHLPGDTSQISGDNLTPIIIVSHPHGCSKQVSLGHYKGIKRGVGAGYEFTYTTATCPGSSGAPVLVLGFDDNSVYWMKNHCGTYESNRELNYCITRVSDRDLKEYGS